MRSCWTAEWFREIAENRNSVANDKNVGKGKKKFDASSSARETTFSLVDDEILEFFNDKCQGRIMAKQHYYKVRIVEDLHIPKNLSQMNHQGINYFLRQAQDYNEDLM
ncbi:unnamed protein product [Vicia faba]|uniref:Uncharacterized protein n=1 Tax=Vicia faba TaxID=3906 RepID=A0AAV0Z5I1_VICFA|nr:unnamed protein product [Vicia faba]